MKLFDTNTTKQIWRFFLLPAILTKFIYYYMKVDSELSNFLYLHVLKILFIYFLALIDNKNYRNANVTIPQKIL